MRLNKLTVSNRSVPEDPPMLKTPFLICHRIDGRWRVKNWKSRCKRSILQETYLNSEKGKLVYGALGREQNRK